DLAIREGTCRFVWPPTPDGDCSDGILAPQHRHGDEAPMADGSRHLPARQGNTRITLEVAHMNHRAIEDGLGNDTRPTRRQGVHPLERFTRRGGDTVMVGDQVNEVVVELKYSR